MRPSPIRHPTFPTPCQAVGSLDIGRPSRRFLPRVSQDRGASAGRPASRAGSRAVSTLRPGSGGCAPESGRTAVDLLERLRLVVEPVAEHEHTPLALAERGERLLERLAAQRELDLLLGQRPLAGDEVAEDGVLLVADRLIEARRRPRPATPLARLLERDRAPRRDGAPPTLPARSCAALESLSSRRHGRAQPAIRRAGFAAEALRRRQPRGSARARPPSRVSRQLAVRAASASAIGPRWRPTITRSSSRVVAITMITGRDHTLAAVGGDR